MLCFLPFGAHERQAALEVVTAGTQQELISWVFAKSFSKAVGIFRFHLLVFARGGSKT